MQKYQRLTWIRGCNMPFQLLLPSFVVVANSVYFCGVNFSNKNHYNDENKYEEEYYY